MVPTRQPALFKLRRHTDPPLLWVMVVAGSLFLNGVITVSFGTYLQPVKPRPNLAPISVGFIPASVRSSQATSTRLAIASTTPPPTPQSSSPSPSISPSTPSAAPASTISLGIRPKPTRPKVSKPAPAAVTERPTARERPASLTVNPPSSPPIQPPKEQEVATETPDSTTSTHPQAQTVATSGILLPDVPPVPDPSNSETMTTPVTTTQALARNITPSKFLMQVKVLASEGDRAPDSAPNSLTPLTKTFASGEAGCTLTPDALRGFNQPITFNLTLDPTGTVAEATPASSARSDEQQSYEKLASCTLKTWTFDPAALTTFSAQSAKTRLAVQVILTKQ